MVDDNRLEPPSSALRKTLEVGALCNNARTNETGLCVGQSTDVALVNVLQRFNVSDERAVRTLVLNWSRELTHEMQSFTRLGEKPFNSEQKYMAVSGTLSGNSDSRERCYMKGSLESVLDKCKFYYVSEESSPALDTNVRNAIITKATDAADRGLRVIALAYGFGSVDILQGTPSGGQQSQNLIFVGLQCMRDPLRPGVADAVAALQAGRVHVVMITGDSEHTALAIAQQLGLNVTAGGAGCVTGTAIDRMGAAQLRERIGNISVFARTTPRHKMAIVEAFRARGDVVAMTGDGGTALSFHCF